MHRRYHRKYATPQLLWKTNFSSGHRFIDGSSQIGNLYHTHILSCFTHMQLLDTTGALFPVALAVSYEFNLRKGCRCLLINAKRLPAKNGPYKNRGVSPLWCWPHILSDRGCHSHRLINCFLMWQVEKKKNGSHVCERLPLQCCLCIQT